MKKIMFVVLALIAMLASIAAAPMQETSVILVGVSNGGGGPVFTFSVNGPVNLNNGIVHSVVGEYQGDFPLFCKQENETTVVCHASKKVSGDWVTVELGGSQFWVQVPETPNPVAPSNCYNYYKLEPGAQLLEAGPEVGWVWGTVANICQDTPAVDGDTNTYNGDPYEFLQNGATDFQNHNPGAGYYYQAT